MKDKKVPSWFSENVPEEIINSELFRFNISVSETQTVSVDMLGDVGIDYNDIQGELENMPSMLVYWAAIYSELREQSALIDRKIKIRRGALTKAVIEKFSKQNIKLTDKQLNAVIDSDKPLLELEEQKERLNKHTGKMYNMIDAIKMKMESLRSLAGFARIEMENGR